MSWRGIVQYQSSASKLAKLNTTAVAFEYEVDAKGEGQGNFYEWK